MNSNVEQNQHKMEIPKYTRVKFSSDSFTSINEDGLSCQDRCFSF